jgi:hypothetical protein
MKWLRWWMTMGVTTMVSVMSPAVMASGAQLGCSEVEISTQAPLDLGAWRVAPDSSGFIELHPQTGLATSSTGLSHSGDFSMGQLRVIGPAGHDIEVGLEVVTGSDHESPNLTESEWLLRHGQGLVRLPAAGGVITLTLSEESAVDGRASQTLDLGAVLRVRWTPDLERLNHQVIVTCEAVRRR